MFEKTLPIGSVVKLQGASQRIMILGYCQYKMGDMNKIYDYVGCPYPQGFLSPDKMLLFDHDRIGEIYALGFQDDAQIAFRGRLKEAIQKNTENRGN